MRRAALADYPSCVHPFRDSRHISPQDVGWFGTPFLLGDDAFILGVGGSGQVTSFSIRFKEGVYLGVSVVSGKVLKQTYYHSSLAQGGVTGVRLEEESRKYDEALLWVDRLGETITVKGSWTHTPGCPPWKGSYRTGTLVGVTIARGGVLTLEVLFVRDKLTIGGKMPLQSLVPGLVIHWSDCSDALVACRSSDGHEVVKGSGGYLLRLPDGKVSTWPNGDPFWFASVESAKRDAR